MGSYYAKYEMGATVYGISSGSFKQIVKCLTCNHTGQVSIGPEVFVCPKCDGRSSHPRYAGEKFYVSNTGEIGKIAIEHCPSDYRGEALKVSYMISSTGVGSGKVWGEMDLFPSREEAEKCCYARNRSLPEDEVIADAK